MKKESPVYTKDVSKLGKASKSRREKKLTMALTQTIRNI